MKNKKKKIIIISIVCIAVALGIFGAVKASNPKTKEVMASALERRNLIQSISVTGNIEANDIYETVLSPTQKVTNVYFKEGDTVKKGDVLVKLDTTDLEYQLKKAQINLDIAKLSLNTSLKSGSDTKATENSVVQAQLTLDDAKRNLEDAKKKLEANQTLFDGGFISKDEYDSSKKLVSDLENRYKTAEIALNNAQNTLSDLPTNKNDQISQQRKQVELANTDIANLKRKIEDSSVRSTISGKVIKLNVKEGQYPTQTNGLIQVSDLSLYKVKVDVSQYDAVLISAGQKASIKVKGLDKKYTGTITSIGEVAELTMSGTNQESKVKVEISIDNPDENIKVGYEVDADITLREKPDTFAISFEAVKTESGGKKYVFIIENGKAKKRYVKTGLETDFDVEIIEGLKEGEKFITNPSDDLKEGDVVKLPEVKKDDNKN